MEKQKNVSDSDVVEVCIDNKFDAVCLLPQLVNQALRILYENDYYLIANRPQNSNRKSGKHHVGERSIVFRFAHYLQNLMDENGSFKDVIVDCEYNRNMAEAKSLPSFPNGTYPDVIVHKRGSNKTNLLVIEFKTYWNTDQRDDALKIKQFTDPTGKYKFELGMTIRIGQSFNDLQVCWFHQGHEWDKGTGTVSQVKRM